MGFNLAGLGAAFKGQQEYDLYMQGKKMRDMQLAQMQQQNDPMVAQMAWETQMGMQQPVPPMPGQASVPASPPMPQGAPQMPPGGPQQGAPMPPQAAPPQAPPAPPIPPYKPLNKGPQQEDVSPPMAQKPMTQPMPQPQGQGAPMPEQTDKPQAPAGPPVELRHNMSLQDAQRFIQQHYGNATATQKFAALEKVHGYMSQDAKMEFQERTLDLKSRLAEAKIKLDEEKESRALEHSKAQAAIMELEGVVKKAHALNLEAQAKARPIEASAKKETADARMISAQASKTRASILASGEGTKGLTEAGMQVQMELIEAGKPVPKGKRGEVNVALLNSLGEKEETKLGGAGKGGIVGEIGDYKAAAATYAKVQARTAGIELGVAKIEPDMQMVKDTIQKGNAGFSKWANKPLNFVRTQTSDPDLAAYAFSVKNVAVEFERLRTGGMLSAAQLHAGAQEDAQNILNENMSLGEVNKIMPLMLREIENGRSAAKKIEKEYRGKMRPGANEKPEVSPSTAMTAERWAAMKSGDTFVDEQGNTRKKP